MGEIACQMPHFGPENMTVTLRRQLTCCHHFLRTSTMHKLALLLTLLASACLALAQQNAPAAPSTDDYSGMYTFLADGEYVQLNIEQGGKVTGYVSRYGSLDSDKGAFLDHFIKVGSLNDKHI